MLRQYTRLSVLLATLLFFLIIVSLNFLQTSPSRWGETASHLQGEELLGAKLSEAFGAAQGETNPDEPAQIPSTEHEDGQAPSDVQTDVRPPARPDNVNGKPVKEPNDWMPKTDESKPQEDEEDEPKKEITKIIVMGKMKSEDTDWVAQEMTDWQNAIYAVDLDPDEESPTGHRTSMNKAKEVMPYLTYITDNYPDFPDVMAFIHAHRRGMPQAWHNDAPGYDAVNMLRSLRLDTVMSRGYVNLRCNTEVGCPDEVQPWRDPRDEAKHAEHAYPYIYANFFNASFEEMKQQIPVVATQCCAQFAVSKEQMLQRSKAEYVHYRTFIEETHYDDDVAGRVLEYMWHIIFGRDAVHCENMFQCWCEVYGRCRNMGAAGLSRHGGAFRGTHG